MIKEERDPKWVPIAELVRILALEGLVVQPPTVKRWISMGTIPSLREPTEKGFDIFVDKTKVPRGKGINWPSRAINQTALLRPSRPMYDILDKIVRFSQRHHIYDSVRIEGKFFNMWQSDELIAIFAEAKDVMERAGEDHPGDLPDK